MIALVLSICLLPVPAFAAPRPGAAPSPVAGTRAASDAQIDQDLRARLSRSKLASKKFLFKVQGGTVTIDGRTDVIQHKGIMTRMARAAGARSVVNRIEISEAARLRATERLDAGRRKALVKQQAAAAR